MNINNILESLNVLSNKLIGSIESEVYEILDKIISISPKILKEEPLKHIFFPNEINGIILIANSLLLFYICYYIFSRILNMYNGGAVENVYKMILKTVIILILVNNSYYICKEILNINYVLSESIDKFSEGIVNKEISFKTFKDEIMSLKDIIENDNLSIDGIIKGMIAFVSISMLVSFSIRYVTIIFLIIISPFAFICLISHTTRGISKMWGKLLFVNLIVQAFVKLFLLIPIVYKDKNSIMYKVILLGTMYILYKINNFVREFTSQISLPKLRGRE